MIPPDESNATMVAAILFWCAMAVLNDTNSGRVGRQKRGGSEIDEGTNLDKRERFCTADRTRCSFADHPDLSASSWWRSPRPQFGLRRRLTSDNWPPNDRTSVAASIVSPSSPNSSVSAAAAVAAALNNFNGSTNGQHHLNVTSCGSAIKLEGGGGGSVASIAGCGGSVSSVTSSGHAAYYNTFAAASPEPNNHALLTATGGSYSTFEIPTSGYCRKNGTIHPPRAVAIACRPFAVDFQVRRRSPFP